MNEKALTLGVNLTRPSQDASHGEKLHPRALDFNVTLLSDATVGT